jgi:phage baseplate assembly protein W
LTVTLLKDIKSRNWQISTQGVGLVAEGLEDIRQCLDILLRTQKLSDPLRAEFGSDIYLYIDQPLSLAIPNIIKAIIEAVQIWEKRVVIDRIRYKVRDTSTVDFFIFYNLVDQELLDLLALQLSGGFFQIGQVPIGTLTIYALFPPNPLAKRYQVYLAINGGDALPPPPNAGFATIDEMFNWMAANWSGFATWQKGADRITGFMKPAIFTASITIGLIGVQLFTAPIPTLISGHWQVSFNPNGTGAILSAQFNTIVPLLQWLNIFWASYGVWSVQANVNPGGDFDIVDFDPGDLDTGSTAAYVLALISSTVLTATLEVDIV